MTDFRSVEVLDVYREDQLVANLRRLTKGCEFLYTEEFLASAEPAIALHLPKNSDGIRVQGLANLPTYFAGLLPEGVVFSAVTRVIGSAADDLFAVLAATGSNSIGDIDVRIPGEEPNKPSLDLDEAADLVSELLTRKPRINIKDLAAIPGVQPKLSLGQIVRSTRKSTYIAKFESPEFPDILTNENTFMSLARKCRIDAAQTQLRSHALLVTRFDRHYNPNLKRTSKIHIEDALQAMDLYPNSKYSLEFSEILMTMVHLGMSKASLLDALKLYVFSYIIGNGDLHAKNVSFLREGRSGPWRLAPAYDLLSTLPYRSILPEAERMALPLPDDSYGRFSLEEFVVFGDQFGLPEKAVTGMITRVAASAVRWIPDIATIPADCLRTMLDRARSLA